MSGKLIYRLLFKEHLFIALCAMCSFYQTVLLTGKDAFPLDHLLTTGALTLLFYQLHGLTDHLWQQKKGVHGHEYSPVGWLIIVSILLSIIAIGNTIFDHGISGLLLLLPATLISGLYILPAFRDGSRLRDLRYAKIFLISFTWAWVTGVWPAWLTISEPDTFEFWPVWVSGLERFAFIFALTVPFDIRDMQIDNSQGIKTLPLKLGITKSKWYAYVALVVHMALLAHMLLKAGASPQGILIMTPVIFLVTAAVIHFSTPDRPDHFFSGIVDGCIILEFLLVLFLLSN